HTRISNGLVRVYQVAYLTPGTPCRGRQRPFPSLTGPTMNSPVSHDQAVDRQFGPRAAAYLSSAVHAQGADLEQLAALAREHAGARVLDLGCGGGHVSFQVAPHAAHVTAYDLSQAMLDVVAAEAARR